MTSTTKHDHEYQLDAYTYALPPELIAQTPAEKRDQSRLLVLHTTDHRMQHDGFTDIVKYFRPGDLLVTNNTKVFPARFLGRKASGGKVEIFLLHYPRLQENNTNHTNHTKKIASALALMKSSKRPKPGSAGATITIGPDLQFTVREYREDGKVEVDVCFQGESLEDILHRYGQLPLPPYISRPEGHTVHDLERYQTRFAQHTGSVAAPTAGLHFSDSILAQIQEKGVQICHVTLHVGYGTFAPVRATDIRDHAIHHEEISLSQETAQLINATKAAGGRIWAVGTTTTRTLEFTADAQGKVHPQNSSCDLFIYPGYSFKVIDNLITNFHLPQSSLLFLVSALADRASILHAYEEAIRHKYRFFSYGDAMAIITKP